MAAVFAGPPLGAKHRAAVPAWALFHRSPMQHRVAGLAAQMLVRALRIERLAAGGAASGLIFAIAFIPTFLRTELLMLAAGPIALAALNAIPLLPQLFHIGRRSFGTSAAAIHAPLVARRHRPAAEQAAALQSRFLIPCPAPRAFCLFAAGIAAIFAAPRFGGDFRVTDTAAMRQVELIASQTARSPEASFRRAQNM